MKPTTVKFDYWIRYNKANFISTSMSGKWCIFLDGNIVDEMWEVVLGFVKENPIAKFAKVSTVESAKHHDGQYVICVYSSDYTNVKDVYTLGKAILELLPVKYKPIKYKRDIDTINGNDVFIHEM